MKKIPQQIIPLIVLFSIVIVGFILLRSFLIPESFGKYGHYRADSVDEIAALEVVFAGYTACGECHDDIAETKSTSNHQTVACEACHGPAADHADDPSEAMPSVPRGRDHCLLCHKYNPARPLGFPQILSDMHNPGFACIECHSPHAPLTDFTPSECAACHRGITTEKSVSHHASLDCSQCHDVPEEHMDTPQLVRAKKPTSRSTCGFCHDENSKASRSVPRIDMSTHGERYLCWDCHYPHYPEAGG